MPLLQVRELGRDLTRRKGLCEGSPPSLELSDDRIPVNRDADDHQRDAGEVPH